MGILLFIQFLGILSFLLFPSHAFAQKNAAVSDKGFPVQNCERFNLNAADPKNADCLGSKNTQATETIATSLGNVKAIAKDFLYKDLAAFAAKQVWQSYLTSFFAGNSKLSERCLSNQEAARFVHAEVSGDALMSGAVSDFDMLKPMTKLDGFEALKTCFKENGIGDSPLKELAETTRNYSCAKAAPKIGNTGCKDSPVDEKTTRDHQLKIFIEKSKDLHNIEERLKDLKNIDSRVFTTQDGEKLECKGIENAKPAWHGDCGAYFKLMEECAAKANPRISDGCVKPYGKLENAWLAYKSLLHARDTIISRYPELRAPVVTAKNGTQPAWKVVHQRTVLDRVDENNCQGFSKSTLVKCTEIAQQYFDLATKYTRAQKLKLILGKICDSPDDFAREMILGNSKLVQAYKAQTNASNADLLLCAGKEDADAYGRRSRKLYLAAGATSAALSVAASVTTGGLATPLFLLGSGLAAGTTAYDLNQALERTNLKTNLLHSCLGTYNEARKAEEEFEDALVGNAVSQGIGFGIGSSVGAIAKLGSMAKMARTSKALASRQPRSPSDIATAASRAHRNNYAAVVESIESPKTGVPQIDKRISIDPDVSAASKNALFTYAKARKPSPIKKLKDSLTHNPTSPEFEGQVWASRVEKHLLASRNTRVPELSKPGQTIDLVLESGGTGASVQSFQYKNITLYFRDATQKHRAQAPRKTLAASDLNRALRLDTVPNAFLARVNGKVGVVSQRAPGSTYWEGSREKTRTMIEKAVDPKKFSDSEAFEFLVGNSDLHANNFHLDKTGKSIQVFDHDLAFILGPSVRNSDVVFGDSLPKKYTRKFIENLKATSEADLKEIMSPNLTAEEIEAVLFRRQVILEDFELRGKPLFED